MLHRQDVGNPLALSPSLTGSLRIGQPRGPPILVTQTASLRSSLNLPVYDVDQTVGDSEKNYLTFAAGSDSV
jgi:hypothetical protein